MARYDAERNSAKNEPTENTRDLGGGKMKTVKLGDLNIEWRRGNGLRKSDLIEGGNNNCVLYGELFTKYKSIRILDDDLSTTNSTSGTVSRSGDILVPGTSTAAKSEMVRARVIQSDGVLISGDINIMRVSEDLFYPEYLAYFFETKDARRQLIPYITGTTGIIHISNTGLKHLDVPWCNISEQRRIVEKLDAAFDKISAVEVLMRQNLDNVAALQRSILHKYLIGSDSTHTHQLGDICAVLGGKRIPKGEMLTDTPTPYRYIRVTDFDGRGSVDMKGIKYISEKIHTQISRYIINKTDVFLSIAGTIGVTGIVPDELDGANLTENACRLVPSEVIDTHYLYYFTKSELFKSQALAEVKQSAQPKLALARIKNIKIEVPSIEEQRTMVTKLDEALDKVREIEESYLKKLTKLTVLRQSLLSQAFSAQNKV